MSQKTENRYNVSVQKDECEQEDFDEVKESPLVVGTYEMLPAYSELFAAGFLEVDDQRDELITPSVPEDHGSLKDDEFFY